MEQWTVLAKRADFDGIAKRYGITPVTARIMRNRDLINDEEMRLYLHGTLKDIASPYLLKDVKKAAYVIQQSIEEGRKIRIISDYDVDGVSSNYILWVGLKKCGAIVDYRIPDRMIDGYGINENLIRQAKEDGIETIITCDNGIAARKQIRYANELGITVVVTDHHDIPYETIDGQIHYLIPEAAAVVNPKQENCAYPFKAICGAVVAYKFIQVLFDLYGINDADTEEFLIMAAIATVCDVMPLQGENRILVKEGLKLLQNTQIPGLRALILANELLGKKLTAYHLGYVIGPCINASGRLKTADEAMELLICRDSEQALERARRLTELNSKRKELTKAGEKQALEYLKRTGYDRDKVLVVYLENSHESIAGIIAGRIKEYYNKPVFVLTKSREGVKGSGRSIEPYSMVDEMHKVKECFTKYGGHPMAAGLSMKEDHIEELRQKLNENTSLREEDFVRKIYIDVPVPFYYLSEQFIEELSILEPFGTGNEKPLFAQKDLQVLSLRVLGNSGRCVKLYVKESSGIGMDALYFGDSQEFQNSFLTHYDANTLERLKKGLAVNVKMRVTYHPQINEWRGQRNIQIVIQNYQFI